MYTISPLDIPSDSHYGFYIFCIVVFFILIGVIQGIRSREITFLGFVFSMVFAGVVILISYNASYYPNIPVNEKVVAKFEKFELRTEITKSGKYTNTNAVDYAVFSVPEGTIALQVNASVPMPKNVYLYKN